MIVLLVIWILRIVFVIVMFELFGLRYVLVKGRIMFFDSEYMKIVVLFFVYLVSGFFWIMVLISLRGWEFYRVVKLILLILKLVFM